MVMFCRNCGKDLVGTPEICANCGANPVKATAFCRFCGGATTAQEIVCPKCGAAIGIITQSGGRRRFNTTKTTLKILAVVAFIAVYAVLAAPPQAALKPLQSATSSVIMASTGYSALPLSSIAVEPIIIPRLNNSPAPENNYYFDVNATWPLTVYATYKSTTTLNSSANTTTGARVELVTDNCTYQSSDNKIATVDASGVVHAISVGSVIVTIYYTAAPGSANMSNAAQGKIPITVSTSIPVTVNAGFHDSHGRPQ